MNVYTKEITTLENYLKKFMLILMQFLNPKQSHSTIIIPICYIR